MSRIDDWTSDHILNYVFNVLADADSVRISDELVKMHRTSAENGGAKAFLLARLGKQHYTWTDSAKNWVWESSGAPRWRVFASMDGLSFEVEYGLSAPDVLTAWDDFCRAAGIK
jgi:hypothetical protein